MIEVIRLGKNLNLAEIKIWSLILFKSFHELSSKSTFVVTIDELKDLTGKDQDVIITGFNNMVDIQLKSINYENHELIERETLPMLSCARFKGNNIFYEFSHALAAKLKTENDYKKMIMLVQNQFTTKYAKIIYGLCLSCLDITKIYTEINLSLEQLRLYLDFKTHEYVLFKEINRTILKKSIDEINEKSNLFIEIDYIRERKNVVAITLTVNINKGNLIKYPELKEKPVEIVQLKPKDIEIVELKPKLSLLKSDDMKNFMSKHSITSKILNNKMIELFDLGISKDDFEKYIIHVRNVFRTIKNFTTATFLSSLNRRHNIETFLQKSNADKIKKRERNENNLYTIYKSSELIKVIEFLENDESLFYRLVDKYTNNMSVKVLRYSLGFEELVRSFTVAEILMSDVQKMSNYEYTSFDNWKIKNKFDSDFTN